MPRGGAGASIQGTGRGEHERLTGAPKGRGQDTKVVLAESGEDEKREPGEKTSEKKHRTERNKNQKGRNKKKNETGFGYIPR